MKENGLCSVDFPNPPGCVTDGDSRADAVSHAEEALPARPASRLVRGRVFDPFGVSRQTYRRFEDPDAPNPSPAMIEGIANLYPGAVLSVHGYQG